MEPKLFEHSYGIIPVFRSEAGDRFLMVLQKGGNWSFPKGHPEPGEEPLATARRELFEETGVRDFKLVPDKTISETYDFIRDGTIPVHKENTYYFAFLLNVEARPQQGEIEQCKFVDLVEGLSLFRFEEGKSLIRKAHETVSQIVAP